jgi:hypothetical protein
MKVLLAFVTVLAPKSVTSSVISLNLHDNIVRFVLNPRLESAIPDRVRAQIDSAHIALDDRTAKQSEMK